VAGGAAVVGQFLAVSTRPEDARPWLIAAALVSYGGVRLLERGQPAPEPPAADPAFVWRAIPHRRRFGGIAVLALGGLYSAAATAMLLLHVPESTATWTWLFGVVAALVGAALLTARAPLRMPLPNGRDAWLQLGLLLVILAVAIWLRVPDLATIPPNVHGDEGAIGLEARRLLAGQLPVVFATGWNQFPALGFAIDAASMRIFGDGLSGLRMASAIEGVLSIGALYVLVRRLWGWRPALLAAAFLAMSAWHIHFSRTGFLNMQSPLVTLVALYFLVRGVQDGRPLDWLVCGLAIGLSLEVYYAARLAPVLIAIYLGFRVLTDRRFVTRRVHVLGMLTMAFGATVFFAPMAAVYARDLATFTGHTSGVMLSSPSNLAHELDGYHVTTLPEVLVIQAQHTLEAFHIRGETSLEYGHVAPLFDFWTGALLAMGALAVMLRPGSARGLLLASWVWLALVLGSVILIDALYSPRLVVAIPALVLGPALMLDTVWRGVTRLSGRVGTYAFAGPVVLLLGLALQGNVHDYFDVQIVQRQPAGRFSLLSSYASSIVDRYRLYVIGRPDWTLTYDAPRFLVPNPDAVDVRNAALALPLEHIPSSKGVAFLVENGADDFAQRMAAIRDAYPDGRETVISERPGRPTLTSYLVENPVLVATSPGATRD
jgi:4-amino-4-deoxy-L-arabinose transferase-like glycosyltransferase